MNTVKTYSIQFQILDPRYSTYKNTQSEYCMEQNLESKNLMTHKTHFTCSFLLSILVVFT